MQSGAVKLAIAAGFVGGAAAVSSWWIGEELEARIRAGIATFGEESGYSVVLDRYDRGIFTSDAEMTISLAAPAEGDAEPNPSRLHIRHRIAHGPGMNGLALGQMISTPSFEGELRGQVQQVFGDRAAFSAVTDFGFGNHAVVHIVSPAVERTLPGADSGPTHLQWSGIDASVAVHGPSVTARIFGPGLLLTSKEANLGIGAMALTADLTRPAGSTAWVGTNRYTVASLEATLPALRLRVTRLAIESRANEQDGLYRSNGVMGAEKIEALDTGFDNPLLRVTFERIDSQALREITEALRKAARPSAQAVPTKDEAEAALAAVKPLVGRFVAKRPQAIIDELSFRSPQGAVRASGSLRYVGDGDVSDFSAASDLEAGAEMSAPLALLDGLLRWAAVLQARSASEGVQPSPDPQAIERAVRALRGDWLGQHFIEVEGDRMRSRIEFKGGKLSFNGHAVGTPI